MGSRIKYRFSHLMALVAVVWSVALSSAFCKAQTYNEIFRQKKTQENYLLKQLAYLQIYAGYVKEGYDIVGSGLNTIKGFTSGEFGLHEAFFGSLKLVNPVIKKDYRVAEIASMQIRIAKTFSAVLACDIGFENMAYAKSVQENVASESNKDLDELLLVITSSKMEMSDEQRISRLAKVHTSSLEKMEFAFGFYAQVKQLEQVKKDERKSITKLRRLYEND